MPGRRVIYILLTKNGPTQEQQMAAISRLSKPTPRDEVYADDLTVRRRKADHQFPQRALLQRQLRRGDTVWVASPGRLGIGRDDIRGVLHDLARGGHTVVDASSGKSVLLTEQAADALEFLDRGAIEHKADVLRAARAAKAAAGIVYRPGPKALAIADDAAKAIWRDTVRYTRDAAAKACGVSWRTLHNRFGGRTAQDAEPAPKVQRRRRK